MNKLVIGTTEFIFANVDTMHPIATTFIGVVVAQITEAKVIETMGKPMEKSIDMEHASY